VRSFNFLIEHQCPQCGAPADLKETDRLFACEYCRVRSYLQPKGFFQYVLPQAAPENKNLLYLPYWRFKGMLYSCIHDGVHHRFIDVSRQALNSRYFPMSVGLRSQALKLKFVSPEIDGRFLQPKQSFEDVIQIFENRFSKSLKGPVYHQAHIGETLSLIYSPFYLEEKVYDAILNKPVSQKLLDNFDIGQYPGGRPKWHINFLPALCPACGWDLHGGADSLALDCRNCNSLWQTAKKGFKRLKFAYIPGNDDNITYLPFWRIRAEISGITLDSYADLIRLANLPKIAQNGWNDIGFRFWAPAFKIRPKKFLALARNITLSQPQDRPISELPDIDLYPVTLSVLEAIESLKINLASFMKPPKTLLPQLPDITIKPKSYTLIYIPFTEKHHEFVSQQFRQAINKNQLSLAKNL
jgi:DNA-directed RNA polymerase subunit RPC12/RpoP